MEYIISYGYEQNHSLEKTPIPPTLAPNKLLLLNIDLYFEQSMNQATYLMSVKYNFRGMPERRRGDVST